MHATQPTETASSTSNTHDRAPADDVQSADRLLDGIAIFAELNEAARLHLRNAAVRLFSPGNALWVAGETPDGLHVIVDGEVDVVRGSAGRQHVVHRERAGAIIGDVPLFDGGPYPATAVAATRVRTVFISSSALFAAMGADASLSHALLRGLAARVRTLVERLFRATLRTVRSRLAEHLIERAGSGDGRKRVVTLGCTHADLAERLGTVRETVSREIVRMRRQDLLRSAGRGGYEILDFETLEQIASGSKN